ncbi:MAG TPA: hypothetical protein VLF90_03955 [Patescibacteria group bacterium]|nr:hypothetical protein [Patescibacteria group bacterium]
MPPSQSPPPIQPPLPPASPPPEPSVPQPIPQATDTTDIRQQIAEQLKSANNVLVTVSTNPSVDQLAAAIGLTLVLNKLGKHATAVFSGQVPSIIEFLQPEKTLEKNTDSLRDFIIALDKSKADKLRYKVEDKFVKIFITPYHTALSQKDLEFSQGEFNVDVVIALGVKQQAELDQAITAHGRILHDATVISINYRPGSNLGALNLNAPDASSLSEIVTSICNLLKTDANQILDPQIATAFLTGIVAETDRFSNNKTKPRAMSTAAELMNSGANQQLIATKLEPPKPIPKEEPPRPAPPKKPNPSVAKPISTKPSAPKPPTLANVPVTPPPNSDGSLQIQHNDAPPPIDLNTMDYELDDGGEEDNIDKIHIDEQGRLSRLAELQAQAADNAKKTDGGRQVLTGPDPSAKLSANTQPETTDPTSDAMSLPQVNPPLLEHKQAPVPDEQTLDNIEKAVHSPHVAPDGRPLPDLGSDIAVTNTPSIGTVKSEQQPPPGPGASAQPFPPPDPGLPTDQTAGTANPGAPPPVPPPLYAPPHLPGSDPTDAGNSGVPL